MKWYGNVRIWTVAVALFETLWALSRITLWIWTNEALRINRGAELAVVFSVAFYSVTVCSLLINMLMLASAVKQNEHLIMPYIVLKPFMLIAKVAQVNHVISYSASIHPVFDLGVALRIVQLCVTVFMVFTDVAFWFVAFSAYKHMANKRQLSQQRGEKKSITPTAPL